MSVQSLVVRWKVLNGRLASIRIAIGSFVRGLPLFVAAQPQTPLRVLCVMAFDTLHVLRNGKPLPKHRLEMLAALLDFAARANAAFDNKECRQHECRTTLPLLERAGFRPSAAEYLRRLRDLESSRPFPGGDDRQFQKVLLYREAVVRLSLAMVDMAADGHSCLDAGIRATHRDADLNILFRIVMLCQIIDDVLDYVPDLSAGLPTFLTASQSLPQAFEMTRLAALSYADDRDLPRAGPAFSLRSALFLVSICTKLVIVLGRRRQRTCRLFQKQILGGQLAPRVTKTGTVPLNAS